MQAPTIGALIALTLGLLLLLASGFISASEIAFFSLTPVDKSRVEDQEAPEDTMISRLLQESEKLLATILIANNFVNVSVVMLLTFFMNSVMISSSPVFEFVSQTVILTFLLLLFGEIMPKIYASYFTLNFARTSAPVLSLLFRLFSFLSSTLVSGTRMINRHVTPRNKKISMDDLSHALELTSHEITEEKSMLQEIIKFGDTTVLDVMTSRVHMTALEITTPFSEVVDLIVDTKYSRIPVYEKSEDQIRGILYIKDLLPHLHGSSEFAWQSIVRTAYHVPESKKIDGMLEDFRTKKIHMAIVVDEFGGTSGLITLEDVLEEIIGEIRDEYDEDGANYEQVDEHTWIFEAQTQLNDFYRITTIAEESFGKVAEDSETLAGLLLEIKGDFPAQDELINCNGYQFQVLEVDDRRILKVKFTHEIPVEAVGDSPKR